jgi:flagellar hook protein FlgE
MPVSALYPPLSAFSAYGTGLRSVAHNLANVLTNNFKAGRVTYAELPGTSGVRANGPQKLEARGPLTPYGPGLPPLAGADPAIPEGYAEGSTTDLATEMVNLIVTSRTYQANAQTVRTVDEMLGTVINLKV